MTAEEYEFRSFSASPADGRADEATAAWLQAVSLGFHEVETSDEQLAKVAAVYRDDNHVLSGAYTRTSPDGAWSASRPVATYEAFDKAMNVGGGILTAHLIAGVTVRAGHRRRGLMRQLIETDLHGAVAAGIPIAALYAAEATIYGRFGFAPSTTTARVEVDTGAEFALNHTPSGFVDVADRAALVEVSSRLFPRYHAQTLGAIDRQPFAPQEIAGIWSDHRAEPDPSVRGLLHYDGAGELDGYVSYRPLPWSAATRSNALEIIDIVTLTLDAYFGLWQYLASIDGATSVRRENAPLTDPLPWAMRDRRGYRVTGGEDGLWLRILDVAPTLQARSYLTDGEISLTIEDPLGITTGEYGLRVRGGTAVVERGAAVSAAAVTLGIAELSALYLGGVRARTLADAGRITGTPEAIATLDALMATATEPYCNTHF